MRVVQVGTCLLGIARHRSPAVVLLYFAAVLHVALGWTGSRSSTPGVSIAGPWAVVKVQGPGGRLVGPTRLVGHEVELRGHRASMGCVQKAGALLDAASRALAEELQRGPRRRVGGFVVWVLSLGTQMGRAEMQKSRIPPTRSLCTVLLGTVQVSSRLGRTRAAG
jgi:hypothetical protein